MTLMPELHDALRDAVASPRRRRRARRAGLLALGVVVVSGTAFAATAPWRPQLGSENRGLRPRAAQSSVPQEQLAALAILRRPQTEADRGPLVRDALRHLSRDVIDGVHTDAVRVLFQNRREVAVLIPAQRGPRHGLPGERKHVLCLMAASYAEARTMTIKQKGKRKRIRVPAGYDGWGGTCAGMDRLRKTGIEVGTSPDGSGMAFTGRPEKLTLRRIVLVPDGVARVKVRLRQRRYVTADVHANVYAFIRHDSPASMGSTWYDAEGRVIKRRWG
jgi:hypothetical protein